MEEQHSEIKLMIEGLVSSTTSQPRTIGPSHIIPKVTAIFRIQEWTINIFLLCHWTYVLNMGELTIHSVYHSDNIALVTVEGAEKMIEMLSKKLKM